MVRKVPVTMLMMVAAAAHARGDAVGQLQQWQALPRADRPALAEQPFAAVPLDKAQAAAARRLLWDDHAAHIRAARQDEWHHAAITLGDHTLKFKHRTFGDKPADGWKLFITMHGGGNAPAAVNDQQWENQIGLYQPDGSLCIAPRAPTDTWNLWHEPHIDALFDRLIADAIVLGEVNPNRVYLVGYSAGGDGVYQLAPRMADRFAAAGMMAGHPNDASPLGLRNIGFALHVGELDDAYNRNKVAAEWGEQLAALQKTDPQGYSHQVQLHQGRGHWMEHDEDGAITWMTGHTRSPLPDRVVWKQSSAIAHDRFYWLAMPPGQARRGQCLVVQRHDQVIDIIETHDVISVTVMLSDAMIDLDQPVTIRTNGERLFNGIAPRRIATLYSTLSDRGDSMLMFDASVTVQLPAAGE